MADKDADTTVEPRVAAFDDQGIWHDPGNGQFAKPGWSTAKSLAIGLFDLVENLAKERGDKGLMVNPKGDGLKSIGVGSGDTVRARWLDSKHAEIEVVRDGRLIRRKVAWDTLDVAPNAPDAAPDASQTAGFAERLLGRAGDGDAELDAGLLRDAEALFNHDLGDGFTSKVESVRFNARGQIYASGVIADQSGTAVGSFTRGIEASTTSDEFGGVEIGHGTLKLGEGYQKRGLGSRFIAASMDGYREAGIDRVTVSAGSSPGPGLNGAYTWAKTGFDWDTRAELAHVRTIGDLMIAADKDSVLGRRLRTLEDGPTLPEDFPTPLDIALDPVGAEVLKNSALSWNGVINLSEKARAPKADTPEIDHDAERLKAFGPAIEQLGIADWETTKPWDANQGDSNKPGWLVQRRVQGPDDSAHATSMYRGSRPVVGVSDAYWASDPEQRRAVLYHEAGHTLDRLIGPAEQQAAYDDLLRGPNFAPSKDTPGEMIAEGYALLHTDPQWLADNQPDLLPWLIEQADRVGMPVPDEARNVTGQDFQFRNGDKVDDVLRIPDGVTFEDRTGNMYVRTPGGAKSERTGQEVSMGYLSGIETAGGAPIARPVRPEYTIREDVLVDTPGTPDRPDIPDAAPDAAAPDRTAMDTPPNQFVERQIARGEVSMVRVGDVADKWTHEEGPLTRKLNESRQPDFGNAPLYDQIREAGHVSVPIHADSLWDDVDTPQENHVVLDGHHRVAALNDLNPDALIPVQWRGGPSANPYLAPEDRERLGAEWSQRERDRAAGIIEIDNPTPDGLSPELAAVVDMFTSDGPLPDDEEERVMALGMALYSHDLGGGFESQFDSGMLSNNGNVVFEGSIVDENFDEVGKFTRVLTVDDNGHVEIYNDYIRIDADQQGKGLGSRFTAFTIDAAAANGVDTIRATAVTGEVRTEDGDLLSEMNGAYTWAKAGFDWEPVTGYHNGQEIGQRMLVLDPDSKIGAALAQWETGAPPDGMPTPLEVALDPVGKRVLLGDAADDNREVAWTAYRALSERARHPDGAPGDAPGDAPEAPPVLERPNPDLPPVPAVRERIRQESLFAEDFGFTGTATPTLFDQPVEERGPLVVAGLDGLADALARVNVTENKSRFSDRVGYTADMDPEDLDEVERYVERLFDHHGDYASSLTTGVRPTALADGRPGFIVDGAIVDNDGNPIGRWQRQIAADVTPGGTVWAVRNTDLRMDEDSRGLGYGLWFEAESENALRDAGFDHLIVDAVSDPGSDLNGAYTFATAGYDWDTSPDGIAAAQALGEALLEEEEESWLGEALSNWDGVITEWFPTPLDVALDPDGFEVLRHGQASWIGKRSLNGNRTDLPPVDEPDAAVVADSTTTGLLVHSAPFRAFPQSVQDRVEADTRAWFTHDLGDGFRSEVKFVSFSRNSGGGTPITIDGAILDGDGNQVGKFTRSLQRVDSGELSRPTSGGDTVVINHEYFALDEAAQGKGLGSRFIAATLDSYRDPRTGIGTVTTQATSDEDMNGAYTWAVAGFDWDPARWKAAQSIGERMLEVDPDSEVGKALLADDFTLDAPTPLDVAMDPVGKLILSGKAGPTEWDGLLHLDSADMREPVTTPGRDRAGLLPEEPPVLNADDAPGSVPFDSTSPIPLSPRVGARLTAILNGADADPAEGQAILAAVFNSDLGDGYRAEVDGVDLPGRYTPVIEVKGKIYGPDGDPAGEFQRKLSQMSLGRNSAAESDENAGLGVYHDWLALNPEHQGKGIGSRFIAATEDNYRGIGVDQVTVHAVSAPESAITVAMNGATTWAKSGYDWMVDTSDPMMLKDLNDLGRAMDKIDPESKIAMALMLANGTRIQDPDFPTPLEVALDPIGKQVLTDGNRRAWWGHKPISDRFKAAHRGTDLNVARAPAVTNDDATAAGDVPFDHTQPIPLTPRVSARLAVLSADRETVQQINDPEVMAIARALFESKDGTVRVEVKSAYHTGDTFDITGRIYDGGVEIGTFDRRLRPMAPGKFDNIENVDSRIVETPREQVSPIPGMALGETRSMSPADIPDELPYGTVLRFNVDTGVLSVRGEHVAERTQLGWRIDRGPNEVDSVGTSLDTMSQQQIADRWFGDVDQVSVSLPAVIPPEQSQQNDVTYWPDSGYGVQHYSLYLNKSHQRQGIGSRFVAATDEAYRAAGFDQVNVHAVSNPGEGMNGGYTWAKAGGYDWISTPVDIGERMLQIDPESAIGAKLRDGWVDGAPAAGIPTPLEVALDPVGKQALLDGGDWWGSRPISDRFRSIIDAQRVVPATVDPPNDPPLNQGRWSVGEMVDADEISILPQGTEFSTDIDRYIALGGDEFDNEGAKVTGERLRQQLGGDQVYIESLPNGAAEPAAPDPGATAPVEPSAPSLAPRERLLAGLTPEDEPGHVALTDDDADALAGELLNRDLGDGYSMTVLGATVGQDGDGSDTITLNGEVGIDNGDTRVGTFDGRISRTTNDEDDTSELVVRDLNIRLDEGHQGNGVGSRFMAESLQSLIDAGFDRANMRAASITGRLNGAYTWAAAGVDWDLGYDDILGDINRIGDAMLRLDNNSALGARLAAARNADMADDNASKAGWDFPTPLDVAADPVGKRVLLGEGTLDNALSWQGEIPLQSARRNPVTPAGRSRNGTPGLNPPTSTPAERFDALNGARPAVVFQNGYRDGAVIPLRRDLPAGAGREYTITTADGRQFRMVGRDDRGLGYRPLDDPTDRGGEWISLPDDGPFTVSDVAPRPGDDTADGADTAITSLKNTLLATPEGQAMSSVLWSEDLSPAEWFSDEVMERLERSERFGDIPDGTSQALKDLRSQVLRAVRRSGEGLDRRDAMPQKFYRVESVDVGQYSNGITAPIKNVELWTTTPPTPDAVPYRLSSGQMSYVLNDAAGAPQFAWTTDMAGAMTFDPPDVPEPSTVQERTDVGSKFWNGLAPLDSNMWESDRFGKSPRAALIDAIANGGYAEPRISLWSRPGTPVQSVIIDRDGKATWSPHWAGTGDAVPGDGEVVFSIDDPALPAALTGAVQHRNSDDMSQVLAGLQNGGSNGRQVHTVGGDYGAWLNGRSRALHDEYFDAATTKVDYDNATGSFTPNPNGAHTVDKATVERGFVDTGADGKPRLWLPPDARAQLTGSTVDYTRVRDKSLPFEDRVAALAEQRTVIQRLLPGTSASQWFGSGERSDRVVKSLIDGTADADALEKIRRVEMIQEFGTEIANMVAERRAQALLDNHHVSDEVNAAVIDAGTAGVFGRMLREKAAGLDGSAAGTGQRAIVDLVAQLDGNPEDGPLFRLSDVTVQPQDKPGAPATYGFTLTRPGTYENVRVTIESNTDEPGRFDMRIQSTGSLRLVHTPPPITITPGDGREDDVERLRTTLTAHSDVSEPVDEIRAAAATNRALARPTSVPGEPVQVTVFDEQYTREAFDELLSNTPIDRFSFYKFTMDGGVPKIYGDEAALTAVRTGKKDGLKHVKLEFQTEPGSPYGRTMTVTVNERGEMVLNRKGTRRVVGRANGDQSTFEAVSALVQRLKPHAPESSKPARERKVDERVRVDVDTVAKTGPMAALHEVMEGLGVDMSTDESVRIGNGGEGVLLPISEAKPALAETARAGLIVYPRSWTTALSKDRPIRLQLRTGNVENRSDGGFNQEARRKGGPDLISTPDVSLRPDYADVAGHEFGHTFQHIMPGLLAAEQWHLMSRLASNPDKAAARTYGKARRGRVDYIYEDEFGTSYSGRTYDGGIDKAREVFTTAVQGFYRDHQLGKDPRLEGWAVGIMALLDPSGGSAAVGVGGGTTASKIDRADMTVGQLLGGSFNADDVRNLLKAGDLSDTQRESLRQILDNLT